MTTTRVPAASLPVWHQPNASVSKRPSFLIPLLLAASAALTTPARADYFGSAAVTGSNPAVVSAGAEILGNGGGTGAFTYRGGGNAVDAAVAAGLAACVVTPAECSLGGYGGHMVIWKSGGDGDPQMVTCIDFNSAAGSLASSNLFAGSVDLTNAAWTGSPPAANLFGWKAVGVPGTLAGFYLAQTRYGRKLGGTNYLPFADMLKPALARVANGSVAGNGYYSLASVSNLLMDLYTNSPGYLDGNGQPNPYSLNNPCAAFYAGDIARDIVTSMQANGGLVTYADLTNYQAREVAPYRRHFSAPNGTPAWVCVAPLGSSGLSVLEQLATMEALGWTNGPAGTWDSLHYWHARGEAARLMWKDSFQWLGDPWGGVLPPDFLANGSTNFCDQMLAHATQGYPAGCAWDSGEIRVTNSVAGAIVQAVDTETNVPVLVHWNDIRYGTCNISTCDRWGNCVAMTISMGGSWGAQVGLTNRGLVFGQGMALFDPRPGWPNSIAPAKRAVNNMSPAIVIPDYPATASNGLAGGRPPFAIGAAGGSTIENNMVMALVKYLTDAPSSDVSPPSTWLYNFEANNIIYMRPSYPAGVQNYLGTVGLSAPGGPPSTGLMSSVQAWIAPELLTQPASTNVAAGSTLTFELTATGLPLFYQWFKDGAPLADGASVSGAQSSRLTLASVTNGAGYFVLVTNGAASVTSAPVGVSVDGMPVVIAQPSNLTTSTGTLASFSVTALGAAPLAYHWLRNDSILADAANISGATTSQLNLASVTPADAGTYSVLVSNSAGSATSLGAMLTVVEPVSLDSYALSPIWVAIPGEDGFPYVTSTGGANTPLERSFAYHALSNQLIVVQCPVSGPAFAVYVVNADTGAPLYTLKTNGVVHEGTSEVSGSYAIDLLAVAVAEDGAVYICNESPNASGGASGSTNKMLTVYRWPNSGPSAVPGIVFRGDPSSQPAGTNARWGDVMTARGSGTNTELVLNSYDGLYGAVLKPVGGSLTRLTNYWFHDSGSGGSIGRSLQFGLTNSIFEKRKGTNCFLSVYNTNSRTSALVGSLVFSNTLGGVFVDTTRNLAAGVDFIGSTTAPQKPDAVALYDASNPSAPNLIARYSFPVNKVANANFICQTVIAGWRAYSLDANNGLMAFYVNPPTNSMRLSMVPSGTNLSFGWAISAAVLQGTPGLCPPAWTDLTTPGQTNSTRPAAGRSQFYRLVLRR